MTIEYVIPHKVHRNDYITAIPSPGNHSIVFNMFIIFG